MIIYVVFVTKIDEPVYVTMDEEEAIESGPDEEFYYVEYEVHL